MRSDGEELSLDAQHGMLVGEWTPCIPAAPAETYAARGELQVGDGLCAVLELGQLCQVGRIQNDEAAILQRHTTHTGTVRGQ